MSQSGPSQRLPHGLSWVYTWDVPGSVLGTSLDSEVTPKVYLGLWGPHLGGFYGGLWGLYPGTNHGSRASPGWFGEVYGGILVVLWE